MAAITAADFYDHGGVGPPLALGATAQLFTVPAEADVLVLTAGAAFKAVHNVGYGLAHGAGVGGVGKYLETLGSSAPFQLTFERPFGVPLTSTWEVIAWSDTTPTCQSYAVRRIGRGAS